MRQPDHRGCRSRRRPCLCRCQHCCLAGSPAADYKGPAGTAPAGTVLVGDRIAADHIAVDRTGVGRRVPAAADDIPSAGPAGSMAAAAAAEEHRTGRFVDMVIAMGLRPGMWPWGRWEHLRKGAAARRSCQTLCSGSRSRAGSCNARYGRQSQRIQFRQAECVCKTRERDASVCGRREEYLKVKTCGVWVETGEGSRTNAG